MAVPTARIKEDAINGQCLKQTHTQLPMHEKDDARYGRRLNFRFTLILCQYQGNDESTAFDRPELSLPVSQSIVYTSMDM